MTKSIDIYARMDLGVKISTVDSLNEENLDRELLEKGYRGMLEG